MSQPVTFAICGCGDRGLDAYAPYQHAHPEEMKIVAGADVRPERLGSCCKNASAYPPKCASPATRRCSPSPAWPT
jgi:predicted dehydrogenase